MKSNSHSIIRNALRSLSGILHSTLSGLDYAAAGHSGFEPTVTKGNLTAGTGITIGGTGTGAVIGAGAGVTNSDTGSGAVSTHNGTFTHSDIALNTGARHAAMSLDTNADTILSLSTQALGLDAQTTKKVWAGPITGADAIPTFRLLEIGDIPDLSATYSVTGHTHAQLHDRSHALDGTFDHTIGGLTNTYLVKSDGSKLVPATNTDAQVSAAVTASHSNATDHARSHAITGTSDHTSSATSGQMLKADASGLPINATNTDTAVAATVSASHARSHSIVGTSDHTSSATSGKMLKADANGLPIDASNTDTQVAATVSASHAAVTVSAPISLSGQALSLVNNAVSPATVTAIDTGALATTSDLVVPTSKAVYTYAGAAIAASHTRSHALDGTSDHSIGSLGSSLPVFTDATPKLITKSASDALTALGGIDFVTAAILGTL